MLQKPALKNCISFLALLLISFSFNVSAQPFINGNLSTGATSSNGAAAPAGFTWSEVQQGNTTIGLNGSRAGRLTLADDFTVPVGQIWNLTNLLVFAYSTNYAGATSPFNDIRILIYDTDPSSGTATPIFGDTTTNRFASSATAGIYRIGWGTPGTARQIWAINGNVTVSLNPGRYWIEWQTGTISTVTSNFSPTSTVSGTLTQSGNNAWQHNLNTNAWTPALDGGSGLRQDFPFVLSYTVTIPPACSGTPNPGNSLTTATNVCPGNSISLSLSNNPVVSGLTYQWQSSADGQNWTNIVSANGASYSTVLSAASYFRALVSCAGNTAPSVPVFVNLYSSSITGQPQNVSAGCSESASFRITTAGSSPILGYQWQQRANAAATWTNVLNTNLIKGANSDTLTFLQVPSALNGYQFRVLYLDTCSNVFVSDSATLTATGITANVSPTSATVCPGQPQALTLSGTQTTLRTFNSGTISVTIPDTLKAGATNNLAVSNIPAGAVITSISVKINITHTYIGDLAISLKSPNNSVINLVYYLTGTGAGPSTNGFINTVISSNGSFFIGDSADPYTGVFAADRAVIPVSATFPTGPNSMLADTDNWQNMFLNPNGTWTLGLYDGFVGDVGTLTSWSMDITYTMPTTGIWTSPSSGTIFTDAAATTAYVPGTETSTVYVLPSANTTYSVVTSNPACGSSAPAVVDIISGNPSIITQPADIVACVGNDATFSVSTPAGPYTYQWQVSTNNGSTWSDISGANSASLSLTGLTSNLSGYRYRVIVSICGNPLTSSAATLTVGNAVTITSQPLNTAVCEGGAASFTATSSGTAGYQWQVSTDNGNSWNDLSGSTALNLNIPAVTTAQNGYQYRLRVNSGNCTPVFSAAATLNVSSAAAITTQPSNANECETFTATFSVTASGASNNYQWQVSTNNGATWTNITGGNAATYTTPSLSASDNGKKFRVIVTPAAPCPAVTSSAATLNIISSAVISTQPSNTTVCAGSAATFTAVAGGASFQWQVSTDNGTTWTNIAGANGVSYTIPSAAAAQNNNRYRLVVGGCSGSSLESNSAILTVNSPASISGQPQAATVCAGSLANFAVTAAGNNLSYQWQLSTDNGANWTNISGATAVSYGITAVSLSQNGNRYRVVVSGGAPCNPVTSSSATLTVNAIPDVTASVTPSNTVCRGSSITLTGGGATTYTWNNGANNGVAFPINSTTTYTVTGTTNGCSSTASVTVTVNENPTVTVTSSAGLSLPPGESTTLTASSTPAAASYAWFRNGQQVAGATGNTLTVTFNSNNDLGSYYAVATTADGCTGQSTAIVLDAANLSFISPNPSPNGVFRISLPVEGGNSVTRIVSIYDSKGALVFQRNYTFSGGAPVEVVTKGLSSDVYTVKLHDASGKKIKTSKIVIAGK